MRAVGPEESPATVGPLKRFPSLRMVSSRPSRVEVDRAVEVVVADTGEEAVVVDITGTVSSAVGSIAVSAPRSVLGDDSTTYSATVPLLKSMRSCHEARKPIKRLKSCAHTPRARPRSLKWPPWTGMASREMRPPQGVLWLCTISTKSTLTMRTSGFSEDRCAPY